MKNSQENFNKKENEIFGNRNIRVSNNDSDEEIQITNKRKNILKSPSKKEPRITEKQESPSKLTCGSCEAKGHKRTNRNCPNYNTKEEILRRVPQVAIDLITDLSSQ